MKRKIKLALGIATVLLLAATASAVIAGIWIGDSRWYSTAGIGAFITFVTFWCLFYTGLEED